MKTSYAPPTATLIKLSPGTCILQLSGEGIAPAFDGYTDINGGITTPGSPEIPW